MLVTPNPRSSPRVVQLQQSRTYGVYTLPGWGSVPRQDARGARLNMEPRWESPRGRQKNARSQGCAEERWGGGGP